MQMPKKGIEHKIVLERLKKAKAEDVDWKGGRSWSLVYYAGEEHTEFLKEVYSLYFSENGAGPSFFPSLRRMEAEVVSMVLNLLDGPVGSVGTMTGGGTESILLAIKAYRDWAREHKPKVIVPEILVPESAHPAFLKAAQYFGVRAIPIPLTDDYTVDIRAIEDCISEKTICLVASAPSFPQGILDPIGALGELAQAHGIGLHVDACLGGFVLPFMKMLGFDIPAFAFSVPGVTSISADLHKNGYTAKGASAILYRSPELRRYQFFVSADWPGGVYASPTMMGTRPGGALAAAWATLMAMGENGYLDISRRTMETTRLLIDGITSLSGLRIVGNPIMSVFAFTSDDVDIFSLGDRIDSMGWRINRQNAPRSLHLIVTPNHEQIAKVFLSDLQKAWEFERSQSGQKTHKDRAFLYGGTVTLKEKTGVKELALLKLESQYLL